MNNAKYCSSCGYELQNKIVDELQANKDRSISSENLNLTSIDNKKFKISILLFSILLYTISLTQDGFYHHHEKSEGPGIFLLLFGGINAILTGGGASITWFANPILFFSWITINETKPSFIASIVSTLLSLSFLFFDRVKEFNLIITGDQNDDPLYRYQTVTGYGLGFYLWVASSLILVLGNYKRIHSSKLKYIA
ncbi:MAG: hypothetical protein IPP32_14320 [Bacteroidetes bacterium]|nr:hypothetical protein [Bacteroidota bacterium]